MSFPHDAAFRAGGAFAPRMYLEKKLAEQTLSSPNHPHELSVIRTTTTQHAPSRMDVLLHRRRQLADELARINEELEALQHSTEPLSQTKPLTDGNCAHESVASANQSLPHVLSDYIYCLPTEVLQRIFVIVRDEYTTQAHFSAPFFVPHSIQTRNCIRAPWNLSQVSSRWRSVALGYPHLWSYVGIDIGDVAFHYQVPRGHLYLLGLQMSRAAGQSLHVSLKCAAWSKISVFLPVFLTSAYRWKHLKISTSGWAANELEDLIPVRHMFTSLESLHLECMSDPPSTSSATSLYDAPNLQSVTANSSTLINLDFPWTQIQKVHVLSRSSQPWNASIANGLAAARITTFWSSTLPASSVRELVIDDPTLDCLLRSSASEPSVLSSLVKLDIRSHSGDILKYIAAPHLTMLSFSLDRWDEARFSPLIDFINRSSEKCRLSLSMEFGSDIEEKEKTTTSQGSVCRLQRALWLIEQSKSLAANSLAIEVVKVALTSCGRVDGFDVQREGGKMSIRCVIDRVSRLR